MRRKIKLRPAASNERTERSRPMSELKVTRHNDKRGWIAKHGVVERSTRFDTEREAELALLALRACIALEDLRDLAPCQDGSSCTRGDTTCANEVARMVLVDARAMGYY